MSTSADRSALTTPSYIVLGLVGLLDGATPYDMKATAEPALNNFWAVRHAQYYSEPDRLVELGFLTMEQETGGRRRKTYRLTADGRDAFRAWLGSPAESVMEFRDEALLKIWFGADPAIMAPGERQRHSASVESIEAGLATYGPLLSEGQRRVMQIGLSLQRAWVAEWQAVLDDAGDDPPD